MFLANRHIFCIECDPVKLSAQVDREIMRIYNRLKKDFPDYTRAVIVIAYNPVLNNRLNGVNQKVAHDVSVMKVMDALPKGEVYIFASQVIQNPDESADDLIVTNLAWLQDSSVVVMREHSEYTAQVKMVVK